MNNTLFMWLLFLPLFSMGQTVTTDSTWITNQGGEFFQNNYKVFSNGQKITTVTPIGDTVTTAAKFSESIRAAVAPITANANVVADNRREITELIRFGRTLPGIIGSSPLDSLRKGEPTLLDANGWTVRAGNNSTGLRFRLTAQGVFQYRPDTTTTWRPATYLGGIIRLNAFNGYNTDFFQNGNRWTTIDQRYQIRKANDTANRALSLEDTPLPQPAPPANNEPVLSSDGTVTIGEAKYKYNAKTKLWKRI